MKKGWVIGSGPNGLTAAIVLAQAGLHVTVLEAQASIGGGTRSAALTLPGFIHDVCSAVHPMAVSSPAFAAFPLRKFGLEWIEPPAQLAHPLDDGGCILVDRSIEETASQLGGDESRYCRLMRPLAEKWHELAADVLAPPGFQRHPLLLARFGMRAPWPATVAARTHFRTDRARALFAGMAAHSMLPLEYPGSAAFGWAFALSAHGAGWPIARGGSQAIADALAAYFQSLGGTIRCHSEVRSLGEFEAGSLVLCDLTPRQLLALAGRRLPDAYRKRLERYRYGPGVFKLDWALSRPIPWRSPECAQAATVHIGGSLEEIAASERAPVSLTGVICERPFVLLAQPSLFDATRAPDGQHTGWAYCHIPNGSKVDMSEWIENQVERFAPGFRTTILARHVSGPAALEQDNANLVGGDIGGGAQTMQQLLFRHTGSAYRVPLAGIYLCSSSVAPGPGVHGMCGYHAARMALAQG
jgi:phytoene dehydrogenase-like protein